MQTRVAVLILALLAIVLVGLLGTEAYLSYHKGQEAATSALATPTPSPSATPKGVTTVYSDNLTTIVTSNGIVADFAKDKVQVIIGFPEDGSALLAKGPLPGSGAGVTYRYTLSTETVKAANAACASSTDLPCRIQEYMKAADQIKSIAATSI
ncbi:MAG: hypothetical protein WCO52_00355 [bacterium]